MPSQSKSRITLTALPFGGNPVTCDWQEAAERLARSRASAVARDEPDVYCYAWAHHVLMTVFPGIRGPKVDA